MATESPWRLPAPGAVVMQMRKVSKHAMWRQKERVKELVFCAARRLSPGRRQARHRQDKKLRFLKVCF